MVSTVRATVGGRSESDLLDVVDGIYSAAFGEAGWSAALKGVADHFGGAGGVVFSLDRRSGRVGAWHDHGLDPGRDEYAAHANAINPRMTFSLAQPPGHVAWEARFITDREMDRHAFYDWAGKTSGVRYFMGSRLFDDGDESVFTSIEFARAHGHVSEQEIALYRPLARHIANAWRLHARIVPDRSSPGQIDFVHDAIPWGVIALDRAGRILEMNREAGRILAAGDGLRHERGELRAWQAAATRKLHALIVAASRRLPLETGGALMIARPSGLPGYGVQIMPCPRRRGDPLQRPAVALYVSDLARSRGAAPAELQALFGLSAREAGLAAHLGCGRSLAESAALMGITRNTARNQLQSVFRKTATHGQAELVGLLMKLLPR